MTAFHFDSFTYMTAFHYDSFTYMTAFHYDSFTYMTAFHYDSFTYMTAFHYAFSENTQISTYKYIVVGTSVTHLIVHTRNIYTYNSALYIILDGFSI